MNILIPDSWLREYLDTKATVDQIKNYLSLCGPSVERVTKVNNDFVYHIEITSNRVDMASVFGIAREAAAILPRFDIAAKLKPLNTKPLCKSSKELPMRIADPDRICNRVVGIVMEVNRLKQSPDYIQDRLEKSGIRPLNNLVDITNYIMLETGHPSHVFDYDRVKTNTFIIRKAKKNELLITLDKKKFLLSDEDVIIDDGTGRVIDLPGIMGTENSVVTVNTRRIIFFIESNNPVLIRKTSMRYGIRTMAASINEKHPDPELVMTTFLRGIELYQKVAGATIAGKIIDIYPQKNKPKSIDITVDFINQQLGIVLDESEIITILRSLSFTAVKKSENILQVTPPTFRQFDIEIKEDIVEEVARIYGYHKLPTQIMEGKIPVSNKPIGLPLEEKIKIMLKYLGFTECYNYSFISKETIKKADLDITKHLKVANPLTEETEYMRISLIPSMLTVLEKNQNFKDTLYLFELAKVYNPRKNDLPDEVSHLVITENDNFYHLKGIIENILEDLGIGEYSISIPSNHFFHPSQSCSFIKDKKEIAVFGKLHPDISSRYSFTKDVYIAQLSIDVLVQLYSPIKKYIPIPLYPPAIEDLALMFPENVRVADIMEVISTTDPLVVDVKVIDRYQQTTTLRITYQSAERNLTSEDIQPVRNKILFNLETKVKATLKK